MIFTRKQAHEQAAATYRYGLERAGDQSELALGLLLFVITFVVLACAKILIIRTERAKGLKT